MKNILRTYSFLWKKSFLPWRSIMLVVSGMPYHRRFSYSWWTNVFKEKAQVTSLFKSVIGRRWLVKSSFLLFDMILLSSGSTEIIGPVYIPRLFDQVRIHIHHIHFESWLRSSERGGSRIFSRKCPRFSFSRKCPRIRVENVVAFFGASKKINSPKLT